MIYDFMTKVNKKYGLSLSNYDALWKWSTSKPAQFWEEIWHYTHIKAHTPYKKVSSKKGQPHRKRPPELIVKWHFS